MVIDYRKLPMTEDAVFLALWHQLSTRRGSHVFQKVCISKVIGRYKYFTFSPDIDLLEVTTSEKVIGYELKGYRKRGKSIEPPMYYEGVDEGLANLTNPTVSPVSAPETASIFDEIWVVHPEGSDIERMDSTLLTQTPLGLMLVAHSGVRIPLAARPNPYLNAELKALFLANLGAFEQYTKFKVKPIQ